MASLMLTIGICLDDVDLNNSKEIELILRNIAHNKHIAAAVVRDGLQKSVRGQVWDAVPNKKIGYYFISKDEV